MKEIYNKNGIIVKYNLTSEKHILELGEKSYLFDRLPGSLAELKEDRPSIDTQIIKANINENELSTLLKRDWSKEK